MTNRFVITPKETLRKYLENLNEYGTDSYEKLEEVELRHLAGLYMKEGQYPNRFAIFDHLEEDFLETITGMLSAYYPNGEQNTERKKLLMDIIIKAAIKCSKLEIENELEDINQCNQRYNKTRATISFDNKINESMHDREVVDQMNESFFQRKYA